MSIVNRETDYAIRILRSLSDGNIKSVASITEEQCFAKSFAHKIIKKLEMSDFVVISRGPGGGIKLDCDLSEKSLYDLLKAVDNEQYVNDCFKKGYQCEFKNNCDNCKTHIAFSHWQSHLNNQLKSMKLSTIV